MQSLSQWAMYDALRGTVREGGFSFRHGIVMKLPSWPARVLPSKQSLRLWRNSNDKLLGTNGVHQKGTVYGLAGISNGTSFKSKTRWFNI